MKHLKLFFALFAMLALGVGNAWGTEDVTFNYADYKGKGTQSSGSSYTMEKSGMLSIGNDKFYGNTSYAHFYANGTIKVTPATGVTITKIVLTASSTSYNGYQDGGSITASTGTMSKDGTSVTWTGSATNAFTLKNNKQIRWTKIVVTYTGSTTPKQKYTLTYQAGSVTGSLKVEEGANLLDALKDITPVACDPTSTESIGWSESEITTKQANAPTLLTDADVMPSEEHSVYYVFAKKETTGGGAATEKTGTYTFSNYAAGTQYAKNEEHKLDDDVTIYTNDCHFTSELRIYSSSTNNGYVVSNELPGKIISMGFNAGNKVDVLVVSGSTDGSTWSQVGEVSVTSTSYKDYTLSFGENNYTYFKLDVKESNQVRLKKMSVTYMSGGGTTTISDYTTSCSATPDVIVKTLKSIAISGMTEEYVEGAEFTFDGTCTATYSVTKNGVPQEDETAEVTPTDITEPDMSTEGEKVVTVSYTENEVTKTATYNITVTAKPTYTITWNNAGTTNTTEVVQGETLGTLPEPADCPSGKKFMGWTAATEVNNDGSGITYIKPTDKPTANTTYYAVFAVVEGGDETPTTATVSIADYATANSWASGTQYNTMNIDANITATAAGSGNTGKYYSTGSGTWRFYQNETPSLTISAAAGYEIQTVKMTYTIGSTGVLTLDGSQIASEAACEINAVSVTFSVGNTTSATNGNVQVSAIEVVYAPAAAKSDYSLDCELHQDPYLTVLETAFDFGTVAQNETVTKTFTVTGGYLAEDVALTISGTNASFFSVSPSTIAKADDVEETVTVTYTPTATGDHTATLTIKTGDITKEIALSGKVLAPGKWVLVKDVATLSAGDEIIIASAVADYAIGVAATNNYKGAAITKVGETANTTADVTILTVEATGDAEVPYAFKDGSKYLYAASNSANQLKAQSTNNANGQWAVTITEGVVSIVAAKSSNRNVMQYNPNSGSPIFACYETASQKALAIYRNSENVVKPVISGEADFVGSTQVTITTQSGLTVYYTTDGTDPNNTSTQYTAPFTINATTTVKAIAYDASSNASGIAEMTFTKHELVNVATAMALEKDKVAYYDEFEVVKVVAGKGNIYIKDASGHGLIYDNTLAGELKDGDRVQGFVGISSPYNGLPEAKPVDGLTVADLTITSGVAAEPYDFTSTAIAANDLNKYIVFKEVPMNADVDVTTHPTLTINENSVNFRNSFNVTKTLENGKKYDIYGFVSIYNESLQVSFYQALEQGEVAKTYTVTYNAGGATGTVPVDDNAYTEGTQVTLKSATGLTKEGFNYVGWKVTDESANEITVSSNKFNMPASNVTVTAQWEEIVVTPRQDFSNGYWVLVTEEGQLAAGDKIVVAAVEEDCAMKSYESGNNIKDLAITKLGDKRFLKWTSEVGVFQLASSGSGYTIQDVNTEEYLYAAGTGNNNYLKAADEVPADADAAKPYIWTISYTDGVATVKATSDNRNTLMYNTGSDLFACYASGQKAIALYKHVDNIDPTLVTPSVESGIFSVGAGKYVQFSTGNLQYEVGTNTWSFASEQYEVIGGDAYDPANPTNTNYGMNEPGYTGKLDLFGWSSDGKFGVNPSNADDDYTGEFANWGNLVSEEGWYTLTASEMHYLLNRKKDGEQLWTTAELAGKVVLILLPDNWDTTIALEYGYVPATGTFDKNVLTIDDWKTLEEKGAVLLPSGGSRTGGYGNKIGLDGETEETDDTRLDANGYYFHVNNVGDYGYYWLNTTTSSEDCVDCAAYLITPGFIENDPTKTEDDQYTSPQVPSREKRRGNSVRLVKAIKPNYTRDNQSAGVYGTVCYPENIVWCDGATLYEVAGKEGNKVIFDEVTAPEAGMPYIFIANQEDLYFFCGTDVAATADKKNSLQGTFTQIKDAEAGAAGNILEGNYMLVNNIIKKCGSNCGLKPNRAYFVADDLEKMDKAPAAAPGRRRISLDVTSNNTATGLDNITNGENTTIKVIENGQLIIIRGGEKFNAQGQKL